MMKISVIVPCYNEADTVVPFYRETERVRNADFDGIDFEYIFVDDGSEDGTLDIIKSLAREDRKVRFVSFSRNFGKEAAILAGLKKSDGDLVTLMDADLQDPPFLLKQMCDAVVNEGYDQVGTRRVTRKGEPPVRSFFAHGFYKVINKISDVDMTDGARDYRLMKRRVVDAILAMPEYSRFSKGIFSYVGFKTKWIEYDNVERVGGKSKWSVSSLFKYAVDGIVSFSDTLLSLPFLFGVLFAVAAIALFIISPILSEPLFAVCGAAVLSSSVVLFALGVMGRYIAQNTREMKRRPIYFIKEDSDDNDIQKG